MHKIWLKTSKLKKKIGSDQIMKKKFATGVTQMETFSLDLYKLPYMRNGSR